MVTAGVNRGSPVIDGLVEDTDDSEEDEDATLNPTYLK